MAALVEPINLVFSEFEAKVKNFLSTEAHCLLSHQSLPTHAPLIYPTKEVIGVAKVQHLNISLFLLLF